MIKQNFYYPKYDQYYNDKKLNFLSYLSIVILIFNKWIDSKKI